MRIEIRSISLRKSAESSHADRSESFLVRSPVRGSLIHTAMDESYEGHLHRPGGVPNSRHATASEPPQHPRFRESDARKLLGTLSEFKTTRRRLKNIRAAVDVEHLIGPFEKMCE